MPTVRTELLEYCGYELRAVEHCGRWQISMCPLLPHLPPLADDLFVAEASLDEAVTQARWHIDRMLRPV